MQLPQFELITIKQKSVAAAKDYEVHLGYRPSFVLYARLNATDADARFGFLIDGFGDPGSALVDPSESEAHNLDGAADPTALGSDGLSIQDYGFKIGEDATFKIASSYLHFVVFRSSIPSHLFDLATDLATAESAYGKGTQYDQGSELSDVRVIEV